MKTSPTDIQPHKLQEFCTKNQMVSLDFYRVSKLGSSIYWFLYYVPIPFLLFIIDQWLDNVIHDTLYYKKVAAVETATFVRIENVGGVVSFEAFGMEEFEIEPGVKISYYTFVFNTVRFVYDNAERCFINLQDSFQSQPPKTIVEKFGYGRYVSEIEKLWTVYGKNDMYVAPPKVLQIILKDSLAMMGLAETLCLIFLFLDASWLLFYLTLFLVLRGRYLSIAGAFDSFDSNIQQLLKKIDTLTIRRNEEEEYQKMSVNSEHLVPGDIIEITKGMNLTVDALLISGSCIFNEEGITGVALNQIKAPFKSEEVFEGQNDIPKKHLLLAGSTCVYLRSEINEGCLAIVVSTGYNTFKGKLLRELLMPKKIVFESFEQAMNLMWLLSFLFLIGGTLFVIHALTHDSNVELALYDIANTCFGIFVSTVKPCLPYCLFMGIQSSESRLKAMGVESTNNYKINQAARCKTIIFDKTGTLTMNNNKVARVLAVSDPFSKTKTEKTQGEETDGAVSNQHQLDSLKFIQKMMGSQTAPRRPSTVIEEQGLRFCTNLPKISDLIEDGPHFNEIIYNFNFNNNILKVGNGLVGDDLDLELYRQCPYEVQFQFDSKLKLMVKTYHLKPEFAGKNGFPEWFKVIWTFDYDADLKRSSVIVQSSTGQHYLLSKGAPEEIVSICSQGSIPKEYGEELFHLTSLGYRIIGFSCDKLDASRVQMDRASLESNMVFQGMLTNESFIRPQAPRTVKNLSDAQILLAMATGDNLYTGISIGQKVGLIRPDMVIYTAHMLVDDTNAPPQLYFINFTKMTRARASLSNAEDLNEELTNFDTPEITQDIVPLMESNRTVVLAYTADTYEQLIKSLGSLSAKARSDIMKFIRRRTLVYARCRPVQKRTLIEHFKEYEKPNGTIVMFVGDEANDAEAVEVADISFLMKRSHLSFRASFTSNNSDFASVEALIREGKCSSESGFLTFKFFIFMTFNQLVALFFLLSFFINFNPAQSIVMDIVISLFFSDYINSFQASPNMTYTAPEATMYNFQFMSNLVLHCISGAITIFIGYMDLKQLSFYRSPFDLIPYRDQKNNNMALDVHKVYEGTFFFNSIILLQLFFFLFTNLKSRYRVSLMSQKDSLYYTLFCASLFFHLATLSEIDEPSFADTMVINFFNIGKTFGLIWIYLKMLLIYCCSAYLIEVGLEISYSFNGYLKFKQDMKKYVQCSADLLAVEDKKK